MNVFLALALGGAIGLCLGHMSGYIHAAREDQAYAAVVRRVNREADDALRLTIAEMGDMLAERGQTIQRMQAEQDAAAVIAAVGYAQAVELRHIADLLAVLVEAAQRDGQAQELSESPRIYGGRQ